MEKQVLEAAVPQSLVAQRVELEILCDRPVKAAGHLMKRIPDSVYKTSENGKAAILQSGYGLILDRPVMIEGHFMQVLALTKVQCSSRLEQDPFEELHRRPLYVQVHGTSQYFESLQLFDQLLNSPAETLKERFDLWWGGRLRILKSY